MNKTLERSEKILSMTIPEKIVFIESNSEQIITNPQENLYKFQNLLNLLKGNNFFIIKIAALAMAEILKDVAPMFALNKQDLEEKLKQVISKDERKLIKHEYTFLCYYEKYLQEMNKIRDALKTQKSTSLREFEIVLIKSFTELYKKLYYFNFNVDLLNYVAKYMLSKNYQIQQTVQEFFGFILKENNPNFYKSKLVTLEKLGFYLKQKKLFKLIPEGLWEIYADLKFDYAEEVTDKQDRVKKQEDYINKLMELKEKGKLSKRRLRELKDKSEILEKMKYKKQKEDEKKLKKIINKELKEQEATIDTKKTQKIAKQILLKVFYINFKVCTQYSESQGFIWALRSIDKNYNRVDPAFLKDLQSTLKEVFEFFTHKSKLPIKDKIQRKLLVLNIIIKISQQKNMGLEIEDYYSTSCFYSILYENLQEDHIFNTDFKHQLAVIYLMENLLLGRKIFNQEVIDNFTRVIILNIHQIKDKSEILQTLIFFFKVFMDKYLVYYKTQVLDQYKMEHLPKINLFTFFSQKQMILKEPFMKNATQFPYQQLLEEIKKKHRKDQRYVNLLNMILKAEGLQAKFLGTKPSQYYKKIQLKASE